MGYCPDARAVTVQIIKRTYAVLAYECSHADGAEHRNSRPGINELTFVTGERWFGSGPYAFKELISVNASIYLAKRTN